MEKSYLGFCGWKTNFRVLQTTTTTNSLVINPPKTHLYKLVIIIKIIISLFFDNDRLIVH